MKSEKQKTITLNVKSNQIKKTLNAWLKEEYKN